VAAIRLKTGTNAPLEKNITNTQGQASTRSDAWEPRSGAAINKIFGAVAARFIIAVF
jgi:hypothetical protein